MTQEEKAKRYDEVLEIAKKNYITAQDLCEGSQMGVECFKNTLESIFPELKSEDERIKKEIIEYIKTGTYHKKWIAWLEKQGQTFTKKDVDDAYLKGVTDTKNEIEKQYEANYQIRKDIATFLFNYKGDIKDRAKWMNYLGIKVSFVEKQGNKPQGKSALEAIREEKVDNANKKKYVRIMTREEQIRQAGIEYTIKNRPMCIAGDAFSEVADEMNRNRAFEEGAKWADKTIIEKACEWLQENVNKYSYVIKVENTKYRKVHFTESLIEDFSKAMEE